MKDNTNERCDIHAEITAQLIASIESSTGQFTLPWRRNGGGMQLPVNALTGNAYNGINILSLWVAGEVHRYTAPLWGTYRQWAERGAQVRKGEKSSLVVFYKEFQTDADPEQEDDDGKRRMARASYVFNAGQVDGFELTSQPAPLGPIERMEGADAFVRATGANISHGGDRAYFRSSRDRPEDRSSRPIDTLDASRANGSTRQIVLRLCIVAASWAARAACRTPSATTIPRGSGRRYR